MKGNNTMLLNQATMKAAIEHWLNSMVFVVPVKVECVAERSGSHNEGFEIKLAEADVPTES